MAFTRRTPQPPVPDTGTVAVRQPDAQPPAAVDDSQALAIPDHLLAKVEELVRQIPLADDAGTWGILEKLLAADSWQDLNKPWQGTSGRELAGKRVMIRSVKARPSTIDAGPEIFLVAEGVNLATGEELTFTTSALAVLIQLATAHVKGWLPVVAEITAAAKPTARGNVPYHLTIQEIRAGL